MTEMQRMKSDLVTLNKREVADKAVIGSRIKNDELTQARRIKVDKAVGKSRLKNDEETANRRETKDVTSGMDLVLFFGVVILVLVGSYFLFV